MHFLELDPRATRTTTRLRVRFCDTDLMGIVHHATYFAYFEAGRVEWLRKRGVTYANWASHGIHLPVVEASIRYRAAARFDDLIDVETTLAEVRAASLRFEYRITREEDGREPLLVTEGSTRLACVDDKHAIRRFTPDMLNVLSARELG
jgi:acyl-CoA thioester hydrolase